MAVADRFVLDELLTSHEFFADPYPVYQHLRNEAPIYWSESWNAWVFTRYKDIVGILRDPRRFSNKDRFTTFLGQLPKAVWPEIASLKRHYTVGMLQSDPPDHTRLRGLVNKAFTPRVVEEMAPRIQTIVNNLIDQVQSNGKMDVIRELAYPLPAIVIAEMLGVPPEDRHQFIHWSDDIAGFQGTGRAKESAVRKGVNAIVALEDYFHRLCTERCKQPKDDLMSLLVAAREQGDKLTEDEMISTCVLLLVAGHETTRNLIGNGTLALLRHPDELQKLQNNPDLIASAIEELLRFDSPLQRGWRRIAEDVEIDGMLLRKGQLAFEMLGAANRDPEVFADPDRLDVTRQGNRHVAFGFGIHFCLGAPLARLEGRIAIRTLIERMPDIKLATDELEWQQNILIHGLRALPVAF